MSRIIVVIEDDLDDADLIFHMFKKNSIRNRVILLRDGAEAVEYFFGRGNVENALLPDLIMIDLGLPKVEGMEVLRRLRESRITVNLPVMVISGSDEERDS